MRGRSAAAESGARTRKIREPAESIPWRVLQDVRISFRALGVLVYLLSLPDDWRTNATQLAKDRKEGRDAVETALSELAAAGYLIRERLQYKDGTWGWLWMYGDSPDFLIAGRRDLLVEMIPDLHPSWVTKHLRTGPTGVVPDTE